MENLPALLTACVAGILGREGIAALIHVIARRKIVRAKADAIFLRTNLDILTGPGGVVKVLQEQLDKAYERIGHLEARVAKLEAENKKLREAG